MDGMILTGRLSEFVASLIAKDNDSVMWDFYLHKVFDQNFAEFKASVVGNANPGAQHSVSNTLSTSEYAAAVDRSKKIASRIKPT